MAKADKRTISHVSSLSLRNFKGFKSLNNLALAPLTFIVGPNSSGKSALTQSLLLLAQSRLSSMNPSISWSGHLVDLGSFTDTVFDHNTRLKIHIAARWDPGVIALEASRGKRRSWNLVDARPVGLEYVLRKRVQDPTGNLYRNRLSDVLTGERVRLEQGDRTLVLSILGEVHKYDYTTPPGSIETWIRRTIQDTIEEHESQLHGKRAGWKRIVNFLKSPSWLWFLNETQRVSSARSAPKRWYPTAESTGIHNVRLWGPTLFEGVDNLLLREESRFFIPRRNPKVEGSLDYYLKRLDIASNIREKVLSPYHTSLEVKDNKTEKVSNLIDVGYGASQVLPVIKACLGWAEGMLIVEQPEVHLHPKAQGILAELLCRTSKRRQVIVETHSVHLLNRARIWIAEGKLDPERVVINYISRDSGGSKAREIRINEDGEFVDEWPEGFFDERYRDTMTLLELKR